MIGFTTAVSVSASDKRRVCRATAIMCCKDLKSFSFCEGAGFTHLPAALVEIGAKSRSAVNTDDFITCWQHRKEPCREGGWGCSHTSK